MPKPLEEMTNEELWQLFPIQIAEHNPDWSAWYQTEAGIIRHAVGKNNVLRIEHVGSTAVPGLAAKPIVDIFLEVPEDIDRDHLIASLKNTGYLYTPQPDRPPPHMMFMKGYTTTGFAEKVFHLHIRFAGNQDEYLFRDYLITHPETAREYGLLKMELKDRFTHDRDGYTTAKTAFVTRVTELAKQEMSEE